MAKQHILIAEDDRLIGNAYRDKLTQAGYRVTIAKNGEETLAALRELKPDLLLLDILMPKVDGFGVLEGKQQDDTIKDIPVIIISNFSQETYQDQAKALGITEYIVKANFDIQQLPAKVAEYLGK